MDTRHLIIAVTATAFAFGCTATGPEMSRSADDAVLTFTISPDGMPTKADIVQTSAEQTMKTLDVFVFFDDDSSPAKGQLENYLHATPAGTGYSGEIKISRGKKVVVFAANIPEDYPGRVRTLTDFNSLSWSYAQNTRGAFVMTEQRTVNVNAATASVNDVKMTRQVSRVELKKVTSSLPAAYGPVTLVGAWLHNVPRDMGNTDWSQDSKFWRKSDLDATGYDEVKKMMDPGKALSTGRFTGTLSKGSAWTENTAEPYYAYGYPNGAPQAESADSKDHVTKFVIQIKIGDVNYYYPIGIVGMESNLAYEINNVELTRLGSTDPDKYVSTAALSLSVTVKNWSEGTITGSYNGTVSGNNFVF